MMRKTKRVATIEGRRMRYELYTSALDVHTLRTMHALNLEGAKENFEENFWNELSLSFAD